MHLTPKPVVCNIMHSWAELHTLVCSTSTPPPGASQVKYEFQEQLSAYDAQLMSLQAELDSERLGRADATAALVSVQVLGG